MPPMATNPPSLHKKTHGVRINRRYDFYEMKHYAEDMRISTPPKLAMWVNSFGWCGKAVDSLADRLVFSGFNNDVYGLEDIYRMNNWDILADSAIVGALICGCSFIYISVDESDFPSLQIIDAANATGIIDPITNMLTEGYAVLERNDKGQPTIEAYFLPHKTVTYIDGKEASTYMHPAPYALLVPVIYRPDAKRPFGHSRISRACMDIQDMASRTVKRSEISAEFYSFPQKYILGMDSDAERMDKWQATMSAMLRIDKRVLTLNIELVETDVVKEHIDTAKVIGGDVDFLTKESDLNRIFPQNFLNLQ